MPWNKHIYSLFSLLIFIVIIVSYVKIDSSSVLTDDIAYYDETTGCTSNNYEQNDFLIVQNIQMFLSNESYFNGPLNNMYDSKLQNSLKNFQKAMGIRIDGIVGPTTYKTMQKYDSCTKKSYLDYIICFNGDYKAYKQCTGPSKNYILEVEVISKAISTSEDISEKKDCDDGGKMWHGEIGTLWNTMRESTTYKNCDEHRLAKNAGFDFIELPIPGVTPGVGLGGPSSPSSPSSPSISPTINNLGSTISIAENQKAVVAISATGTGSLTYSLSGTDSRLMSVDTSGVITLNSDADYEQKTSYAANAIATNSVGSATKAFTVNITDVTEKYTVNTLIVYDIDNLVDGNSAYDSVSELTSYMTNTVVPAQNTMLTNSGVTNLEIAFTGLYHWTLAEATYAGSPYNSATTKISLDFDVYKEKIKKGADSLGAYLPGNGNSSVVWDDTTKRRNAPFVMSSSLSFATGKIYGHEWGHSIGLVHSRNQSSSPAETGDGITDYAHGYYVSSGNTFSTTMGYGFVGCGIYSNPDLTCAGDDDDTFFVDDNDGTEGSQAAGEANVSDSSRVLQEYAHEYERLGAETNYGVSVGDFSVKSNAYFPLIHNGTASYSFTESISETSSGTKTIYVKKGSDVTISGTEYESYTWCDNSSCDLDVTASYSSQSGHKIGFEILVNSGNYYLNKVGWSGIFSTQKVTGSRNHYDRHFEAPCLFISHYMKTGQYNEADCSTRYAHQNVYGTSYTDTWSFTNNVKKELVVTPYGAYDAYKYTHSELSLTGSFDPDGAVQVLKFWFSPEVGLLMFEDELMRRWKLTAADTDGDGTDNASDTDDDGDGVLDTADAFPLDPNASADADSDGIADGDE